MNTVSLRYLDLEIGNAGDRVVVHPAYKHTALGRRLSHESAHFDGVHRSWVRAMYKRARARCVNTNAELHIDILSQHLISKGVSPELVEMVLSEHGTAKQAKCAPQVQTMWVPLPYHPVWFQVLKKTLRSIGSSDDSVLLRMANFKPINFRPAWSNSTPNLAMRIIAAGRMEEGVKAEGSHLLTSSFVREDM